LISEWWFSAKGCRSNGSLFCRCITISSDGDDQFMKIFLRTNFKSNFMMKKVSSLFALSMFALFANATVWTVDKTPGAGAQFVEINSAISASANGDTLLVHSCQYSYGGATVDKSLTIIGPGHYPTVSGNLPASVANFLLVNGGSGTLIEGFVIGTLEAPVFNQVHNITIRNNYFSGSTALAGPYGDFSGADNWLIEGNVFADAGGCSGCSLLNIRSSATGNDNWTFRNNFIQMNASAGTNAMISGANSTTIFANNILVHPNVGDIFLTSSFALLENNIFFNSSASLLDLTVGCASCTFNNNLFYHSSATLVDVPGVGNIMNENPEFVHLEGGLVDWNYANDYHLNAGSPAIGTAADGDDMGIYGADYNFRMFGYTNDIPRLTEVLPQYIVVPVNGSFTIDFSAAGAGQ
jgi:hypothetical protein